MNIALTDEQQNAYNVLTKFVKNKQEKEMLLIGYAGTGKTTLISKFIIDTANKKKINKLAVVAPTHKAVNIIKSKLLSDIDDNIKNKIEITTVHSLLSYNMYVDKKGTKFFAKGKHKTDLLKYDLIIIDECSMLSNQIVNDLDILKQNTKILYVGDPAQLPPVNHSESKIFNKNIKNIKLEQIIRTKNEIIHNLSQSHRFWIFDYSKIPNLNNFQSENITFESVKNKEIWLNKFVDTIKTNDLNNLEKNIILTWTNEKCNTYNQYIRKKIFNKDILLKYEIGEILLFDGFYKNNDITFHTSEKVKIITIENEILNFKKLKEIEKDKYKISEFIYNEINKFINTINTELNYNFEIYKLGVNKLCDLKNITHDENGTQIPTPIHNINVLVSDGKFTEIQQKFFDGMQQLQLMLQEHINNIDDGQITNMDKTNYLSEILKITNIIWKKWNSNIIDKIAVLNYGYAITTHKAQGGTFDDVYIDVDDILNNHNKQESLKCLYTAITRCSTTINLLLP